MIILLLLSLASAPADAGITSRDAKLRRCMVYLPDMKDLTLRRWCLKQSKKMP